MSNVAVVIERSVIQGQHDVSLVKIPEGYYGYIVEYGGDVKKFLNGHQELEKALKEYNECVLHQMGCAGYFDEYDTK